MSNNLKCKDSKSFCQTRILRQRKPIYEILLLVAMTLTLLSTTCSASSVTELSGGKPSLASLPQPVAAIPLLHDYNIEREFNKRYFRYRNHFVIAVYDSTQMQWSDHFLQAMDKKFRFYRAFTKVNMFRYDINSDKEDMSYALNRKGNESHSVSSSPSPNRIAPYIANLLTPVEATTNPHEGHRFYLKHPVLLVFKATLETSPSLSSPVPIILDIEPDREVKHGSANEAIYIQISRKLMQALPRIIPSSRDQKSAHAMQETNDYIHKFYSIATTLFHDDANQAGEAEHDRHVRDFMTKMELNADELACTQYGFGYRRIAQLNLRIARLLATGYLPALQGGLGSILEADGHTGTVEFDKTLGELISMYLLDTSAKKQSHGEPEYRSLTKNDVEEMRQKLQKYLNNPDQRTLHPRYVKLITDIDVILGAYIQSIPKIVHFIRTDAVDERFGLLQYLSVMSAYHNIKPDVIYMHTVGHCSGYWWNRAKKYFTVRMRPPPMFIGNKRLRLAAHQSDAIRVDVLDEYGGIYLDWDVIVWRSFDPLLKSGSPTIFGRERRVPGYDEVVGVAVILSRPQAPFIKLFKQKMDEVFDGEKCYACHSVSLVRSLSTQKPSWVRLLLPSAFNSPGWEREGVARMFSPKHYDPSIASRMYPPDNHTRTEPELVEVSDVSGKSSVSTVEDYDVFGNLPFGGDMQLPMGYTMHLFESNAHFQEVLPQLTEENIKTVDTNFNVLMRRYL